MRLPRSPLMSGLDLQTLSQMPLSSRVHTPDSIMCACNMSDFDLEIGCMDMVLVVGVLLTTTDPRDGPSHPGNVKIL